MFQITSITSEARQKHKLPIDGYDSCSMTLEWKDTQLGWFASFSWGDWSVSNIRVCALPNILSQWSNVIPFGIVILSKNGQDPMAVDAFSKGESSFYILTSDERSELEALYG